MSLAHQISRQNGSTDLVVYNPKKAKKNNAKADALIDYAKRVKDWDALNTAVDAKLEEQKEFVGWWDANVRGPGKVNSRRTGVIDAPTAEAETGITNQQVSRWRKRLVDPLSYRQMLCGVVYAKAMAEAKGEGNHRAQGTGENEWYTPQQYIELARSVMGSIDLNPASSNTANEVVNAGWFYSLDDNGLDKEWVGNVWLNPPYAQPAISHFADKMVEEWQSGRVTAAIVLTHNYTDTAWFQKLARAASAICFTRGRVRFVSPTGELAAPTQGQAFFYFGHDVDAFASSFADVGFVVEVRQ